MRGPVQPNQHYEWGVGVIASLALTVVVKRIVSVVTLSMGLVVTLELLFGYAATTPVSLVVQWISMIIAYILGALWWFGPWPTLGQAFAFVVIADLSIFWGIMTANFAPEVTLGGCTFLIPVGMLAGFFFDKWRLAAHIALCLLGTSIVAVYVVSYRDVDIFVAFVLWAPIVVTLTGFVSMLQLCSQSMRLEFD